MTDESAPFETDPELYRQWRQAMRPIELQDEDFNALAAYAERRMEATEIDAVETLLAAEPALLDAVLAARAAVADTDNIVRFQPRPQVAQPRRLIWAALAASILLTSYAGYSLGVATQEAIEPTNSGTTLDLIDLTAGSLG
jgi:hypothetical protein